MADAGMATRRVDGSSQVPVVTTRSAGGRRPRAGSVPAGGGTGGHRGARRRRRLRAVVIGGGIGGFTTALALEHAGLAVTVVEQAPRLGWVGAAVNLTPNAVRALDGLGLAAALRRRGVAPRQRLTRHWTTGEVLGRLDLAAAGPPRYGAPELFLHRAALLDELRYVVTSPVLLGRRVVGVTDGAGGVVVTCESGERLRADVVVGADGIHSVVRRCLVGDDVPTYTGATAYRAFVDLAALAGMPHLDSFVKWSGPTVRWNLVTFPISVDRLFIFGSAPGAWADRESWSRRGSVEEVRRSFAQAHPDARRPFDACTSVLATALYARDPLATWVGRRVALLGDACHPMTPYMAQGGAMAIEDAVVLSRCLAADADVPSALATYQRTRRDRVATIQQQSNANAFRPAEPLDVAPVYGFDAWQVPLVDADPAGGAGRISGAQP